MSIGENLPSVMILFFVALIIIILFSIIKKVPQSEVYVIERFGKYRVTLHPGLKFIAPFIDSVAHRVSILERQLKELNISVITKDNVEVQLETIVFFRVIDASRSVYRIRDINEALKTAAASIVRSAAGKLELDELQSSREAMNVEIETNLSSAAEVWGVEITRTEIVDVIVDQATKEAQRQQLIAERQRRATIAEAEGEKRSVELLAEAEYFKAKKEAEAIKVTADADAYSVRVSAEAEAEQTRLIAEAISKNGQPAINYEIAKKQVDAIADLAGSQNSKTLILPTEITGVISSAQALLETMPAQAKTVKK